MHRRLRRWGGECSVIQVVDDDRYAWMLLWVLLGLVLLASGHLLLGYFSSWRRKRRPYTVFTMEFDREVHARDLDRVVGPLLGKSLAKAEQSRERYQAKLIESRHLALAGIEDATRRLQGRLTDQERADFFITLLVDQSGSLKGDPIILAATACSLMQDFITGLGARCEVLGFTTTSWKGGRSREKWQRLGYHGQSVGRLCDLLHIVYKAGDEPASARDNPIYQEMLRPGLLKENVDGEAIEWATRRLRSRPEKCRILIVLSDGVPVDDSTLLNNDNDILDRHLRKVIAKLERDGDIKLAALGLKFDVSRFYRDARTLTDSDQLAVELVPVIERLMSEQEGQDFVPATAHVPIDPKPDRAH